MTTFSVRTIVVASKDQVSCDLQGEAAILNLGSGIYFGLNPVGARVWSLIQEPRSVEELREALVKEFEVEPAQCEADILALLQGLLAAGLIDVRGTIAP
jgi:hypothetical protein